ncbi:hypothetical protein FOA52_007095 [Chlamydomonas sp. UWO 241]|nr:hypothetical protein FOA52_007095 [Chlamydomonas sp. UWO 241]
MLHLRKGPTSLGCGALPRDSADIKTWDTWHNTGLFYGITTNPTILERDGVKCGVKALSVLALSAFERGALEVQLQAWGDNASKMTSNALSLAGIDPRRIVVKLPATADGLQTAALLRDAGIRVTITGMYMPHQVLLAEAVGAEYAAPYLGRMNDLSPGQGTAGVEQMQAVLRAHGAQCRLLVASLRDPSELAQLSAKGCDTFTISPAVTSKMFAVESTIQAAADFEDAARRMGSHEDC